MSRFNINDFLINLYFHFDCLQNERTYRKNFLFFVTKNIPRSLNFIWFGCLIFYGILRMQLKLFFSLNISILSQDPEIKSREIAVSRLNRIISLFSNPIIDVSCQFLNSVRASLINLNRLFQRHNPVTYVRFDALPETLCMLLSRFMLLELMTKLAVGKLTMFDLENSAKYLSSDNIYICIARNFLELQFDDGDINQEHYNKFLSAC